MGCWHYKLDRFADDISFVAQGKASNGTLGHVSSWIVEVLVIAAHSAASSSCGVFIVRDIRCVGSLSVLQDFCYTDCMAKI